MERPNASAHFRGKHRYNCAQAVLKAYAEPIGLDALCLEQFSHFGTGRAPEGECGALFAAKAILRDAVAKKTVEEEFVLAAGSGKCREIRSRRVFTCEQCVQMAADAVFARIGDGPFGTGS